MILAVNSEAYNLNLVMYLNTWSIIRRFFPKCCKLTRRFLTTAFMMLRVDQYQEIYASIITAWSHEINFNSKVNERCSPFIFVDEKNCWNFRRREKRQLLKRMLIVQRIVRLSENVLTAVQIVAQVPPRPSTSVTLVSLLGRE